MISVTELDERIERCLAILADNPHSQVFAALAEAYRRRGEFGRAFSVCKSGLKHHPDYAPAHVVMAKLFLHQNMIPEADDALKRAVHINGPTRATDLVEAELHLATGNADAAQAVISRLQRSQPGNPVIAKLTQSLRELRSGESQDTSAKAPPKPASTVNGPAKARVRSRPSIESPPVDWAEWGERVSRTRGAEIAAAFDVDGNEVTVCANMPAAEPNARVLPTLFWDLNKEIMKAEWGSLTEVRIELSDGEIWVGRVGNFILGLTGNDQLAFGEARQRALEIVAPPESHATDSAESEAADHDIQSSVSETTTPHAEPSEGRVGAGRGYQYDS